MYAVVESGGKQHRVREGDLLRVEKVAGDVGSTFTFDKVLMIGGDAPSFGAPLVDGATVEAEIVQQARSKKVLVFKKQRRKNYRRMYGHRQPYTHLRVKSITVS